MEARRNRRRLWIGAVGAVAIGFVLYENAAAAAFERSHPGFVTYTLYVKDTWESRPPSLARTQVLDAVEDKLRWAAWYQRLGFDPDLFREMRVNAETGEGLEADLLPPAP